MAAVHTTSPASPASSPPTSSSCSTRASRSTDTRISHVRSGTRFGPPTPILHDSERRYCVEGLIDVDAFGRVAIASVLGTSSPVLVAIKVYGKDLTPHLDTMHDNECRIMRENASCHSAWLVWSHGAFGDEWNRYLIMVSWHLLLFLSSDLFLPFVTGLLSQFTCSHYLQSRLLAPAKRHSSLG